MTREDLAKSISSEAHNHSNFLLDIFPRVGKSLISMEIIKKWSDCENILILSGANTTNNQWIDNIRTYNPELLDKVKVLCYQSLHKIPRDFFDTILLDEFDLAVTDKRISIISEFSPKHWIAMSGTLNSDHIQEFRQLTKNKFYNAKVSFEEAVDWGILPQPVIYVVKLQFDNSNPYLLYYNSRNKNKKNTIVDYNERWFYLKDKTKNTIIRCTEFQFHELITQEFERWKNYENEFTLPSLERSDAVNFLIEKGFTEKICRDKKLRIGNERKKFFSDIKNRWFKKLFNQLPENSRVLVFCNDTKQADILNREYAVHSKNLENIKLINQFNNFEINRLFTCKLLDRGVDFNQVDYLIIIQSSMKQGSQIQRFGRSLLSTAPKIILFYYPDTQDEKYVKEFLKQFKEEWIIYKLL